MSRRELIAVLLAIILVVGVLWVRHRGVAYERTPARLVAPLTQSASAPASTGSSWTGIALSGKVGPYLSGARVYVDLPSDRWPREIEGKRIIVTGTVVVRYDLPVFIAADHYEPGTGPPPGIPVPKGTDLHEASRRVVIENARWTLAPE